MQSCPLSIKERMSERRIMDWYSEFTDVYVSFSGGKDSTVLSDMVARVCQSFHYKMVVVFSDTGLEYPEIRKFVPQYVEFLKKKYSIEIELVVVKPEMTFKKVIETVGYPIGSKKIARMIYDCKHPTEKNQATRTLYMTGVKRDGSISKAFKLSQRWMKMIDSKFEVSDKCCDIMKKEPTKRFEKETGMKSIVGTMACESNSRKETWLQYGCNAYDSRRPQSKPMSFWTEQDVLEYILKYDLPFASVYGSIIGIDKEKTYTTEQVREMAKTNDGVQRNIKLQTTGCQRTGCMFCMFGCHLEKQPNRFQKMKETHPAVYNYCMKPVEEGGLGLDEIMTFMDIPH
ncbi:MAG: phosphoadenosine phosphosulfate reductase family protein [Clostridia bacterium]|nr:phosphoadenosine phosphosulfate reductase family protein [Clostridia bacterium]